MSQSVSTVSMAASTATPSLTDETTSTQRGRTRRFTNKKRRNPKPRSKFEGAEEAMKGHIYDVERPGKQCEFITTTEFARDLVYRTYNNPKLLEEILTEYKETPLTPPKKPEGTARTEDAIFEWQLEMKEHIKNKSDLQKLKFALWALLWR